MTTTLGPYTLIRRLGAGGMGEVWIARRSAIGGAAKLVAIKTVLPEKASNPESRRMFLDEARLSMLMNNSNIVQVFDVDEAADGTCYMAMEYVEGIDLARLTDNLRARGELLSQSAIAYILAEVLKGLAHAHDLNVEGTRHTVVHRDISPQNVMISVSGEVKLTDFGIARLSSEETSGSFIRGKFRYMPPEQFEKGVRAPTLDLFAVGAILHELLDGQRFRGGDFEEPEMIGMCVRGTIPPLTCPPERVPAVFEQLRKGLLEREVANRIASARAAHRLLSQWPGDRDAKFELEEIVQRLVGDSSPVAAASASASASGAGASPGVGLQAPTPETEPEVPPTESIPHTELDTDAARRGSRETPADEESTDSRNRDVSVTNVLATHEPSPIPTPASNRSIVVALALAGMGFAVMGVTAMLGWWSDEEPAQALAEAPAKAPEPQSSTPEPLPLEPKSVPEPSTPEPPPTEPAPVPEPVPVPEPAPTEPTPTPEPTKPKQVAKTTVTITAAGVWAEVKIGGKQHTFDRLKGIKQVTVKLEPGDYTVSFRDDPEVPWQSLGKVRIPEESPATLDIKAGKATVGK